MALTDLTAITNSFVELGGAIFGKRVLNWDLKTRGIQVRTNVNKPQVLAKLSAKGGPMPYRGQDDTTGNGVKFTDRTLTVYQSKWDYDFDPKEFHNNYLAGESSDDFVTAANDQVAKEYLDQLTRSTIYFGVRNAAGTGAADLCDGFGTIIAAEIVATKLVPVVTGALTAANAVDKVELVAESVPVWMREQGFVIYCSYATLDKYKKHYRTLNGFGFSKDETGKYKLDGINATLEPLAMMGNSGRLIATVDGNLVVGTDIESIAVEATKRRNIIEVRQLMDLGTQIQDLDALVVNDQA